MSTNPTQSTWPLKKPQQLVYVELGSHNGGMMLGVCEIGLTFRAVAPLKNEGPLPFSFALDGKRRLQGVGEIAWTEDDGKTGGLKFTNVSPEFRSALRAWIEGESLSKQVGREMTPAAALPLDSIEKIKSHIRDGSMEEIRAVAPARQAEVSPQQTKSAEAHPAAAIPANPNPVEEKPAEHLSPLPKFRLPAADPVAVPPPIQPASRTEAPLSPIAFEPVVPASPELEKEYPPLAGLHQPYAHVLPETDDIVESPRINRAAAAGIVALALSVILVALVLNFRREVGETLIRLGEELSGENRTAVLATPADPNVSTAPTKPIVTSVSPNSSASAGAASEPAASNPSTSTSAQPASVQRIEDIPAPADGGSGQKEFEQARNILKGNRRQRELPFAVNLLWTGVRKGYVPAEVTLADLYARGDGVEQSCEQARVLLRAAIQKGSPEGRRRLDQLIRQGCPFN
ncbi:MAG: hypothetical protein NVS9B14_08100 [Candidatus Acidiferrum sp.]